MKKIIIVTLTFVFGFIFAVYLFNAGYKIFPILKWEWSNRHARQNCLFLKVKNYDNGAAYNEIYCYKNAWQYED